MVKLTFPIFAVRHQKIGGVESAIYNLIRGLAGIETDVTVALSSFKHISPEFGIWLQSVEPRIAVRIEAFFGSNVRSRFLEEALHALRPRSGWTLYPNYHLPMTSSLGRSKNATIIHDFQHLTFPQYFTRAKSLWLDLNYRRSLLASDMIFFISEFERSRAVSYFGESFLSRSSVIYNAVDWSRFSGDAASHSSVRSVASRPYILTVCHQHKHKNLPRLLEAFSILSTKRKDIEIILVGTPSKSVRALAERLPDSVSRRVHFTGFISDSDLGFLYRNMSLFVLPSLYEGFGMPAVEAMNFGRPILLSDAAALKEVTMNLATYVPANTDAGGWADAIDWELEEPAKIPPDRLTSLRRRYTPTAVATRLLAALN